MAVMKRRSRMVSFRLSDKEYEELKNACIMEDARSLSDVARSVLCHTTNNGARAGGDSLEAMVRMVYGSIQELNREIKRLAVLVEGTTSVEDSEGTIRIPPRDDS